MKTTITQLRQRIEELHIDARNNRRIAAGFMERSDAAEQKSLQCAHDRNEFTLHHEEAYLWYERSIKKTAEADKQDAEAEALQLQLDVQVAERRAAVEAATAVREAESATLNINTKKVDLRTEGSLLFIRTEPSGGLALYRNRWSERRGDWVEYLVGAVEPKDKQGGYTVGLARGDEATDSDWAIAGHYPSKFQALRELLRYR